MKKDIFIGCSSFNNRYWKGIFYPEDLPVSKWFDFYCQHFDTYEMNGTFYKFPTQKILENWYNKVPENFLFSVKVPKEITHVKKFDDCELILKNFYKVCQMGLKEKLGCILFQFPPSYDFSPEKLQNIIQKLDSNFKNVIEFRHKSWWRQDVWDIFLKHSITFCSVSYPGLPDTFFTNFPVTYIRLHGHEKLFYSNYDSDELAAVKVIISKENQSRQTFVYFNNTASTAGILNALKLKTL